MISLLQSSSTFEVICSALYCSWSRAYPGSDVFSGVSGARTGVGIGCEFKWWVIMWASGCGGQSLMGVCFLDWCQCAWYSGHVSKAPCQYVQSGARWPSCEHIEQLSSQLFFAVSVCGVNGGEYCINIAVSWACILSW